MDNTAKSDSMSKSSSTKMVKSMSKIPSPLSPGKIKQPSPHSVPRLSRNKIPSPLSPGRIKQPPPHSPSKSIIARISPIKQSQSHIVKINNISPNEITTESINTKVVHRVNDNMEGKKRNDLEDFLHDCTVYVLSQGLALIILSLLIVWIMQYHGGFGYTTHNVIFNLHPLFLILGCIYILSNSLLFLNQSRLLNPIRFGFLTVLFALVLLGLFCAVYWHVKDNILHLFTMHSWLGMATFVMLMFYAYGNISIYIRHPNNFNDSIMQLKIFGICTLILATMTTLTGLNQMETVLNSDPHYENNLGQNVLNRNHILINIIAIFLIVYIFFMIYMTVRRRYRYNRKREQIEQQINLAVSAAMEKLDSLMTESKTSVSFRTKSQITNP